MAMTDTLVGKPWRARWFSLAAAALLLALTGLHIYVRVNPQLIYHNETPIFMTGSDFFSAHMARPGGPVEYVSMFIWQFYHYRMAASVMVAVLAGLMCLGTWRLMKTVSTGRFHPMVYFIPAVLLALVHNFYRHDLTTSVQILAAVGLANLYAWQPLRRTTARLVLLLVLSPILYYLIGGGYVLFAVLCGLVELLARRKWLFGLLWLALAPAVPLAFGYWSYQVSIPEAFGPILPFSLKAASSFSQGMSAPVAAHLALVCFFPLAVLWAAFARRRAALAKRFATTWAKRSDTNTAKSKQSRDNLQPACWSLRSVSIFIVVAALVTDLTLNRVTKTMLETNLAARNGLWSEVLTKAAEIPIENYSVGVMKDVNVALYHLGRLPYDMFTWPQRVDRDSLFLSFALAIGHEPSSRRFSETFYNLGFIAESEHYTHNSLEQYGPLPVTLKRLARINLLKDRPMAAKVFISALGKNPLYRQRAQDYLDDLRKDPLAAGDEEVKNAHARMIRSDYTIGAVQGQQQLGPILVRALRRQLQIDKHNKMAFEYLMAHYLRTRQLDAVVANLRRLGDFGYPDIPRHYEEAVLLYEELHANEEVPLYGRHISQATRDSYRSFREVIARSGPDMQIIQNALAATHDKTYLLYYTLGFSDARLLTLPEETTAVTGASK